MENNIDKDIEIVKEVQTIFEHLKNHGWVNDIKKEVDIDKVIPAISNVLSELETYKKIVDELKNKVHYKICESCNKEYRTKRSDTKYCKECAKKVNNSNWYNSLSEEKKQERREKSKLAMRKNRARKEVNRQ